MPLILIVVAVVVLLLVGWLVVGLTLKLIGLALTGLVVGALARLVLPGEQELGWLGTILYGIAGSLIGAIVANLFDFGWFLQLVLAVAAAALLIAVFATTARRDGAARALRP